MDHRYHHLSSQCCPGNFAVGESCSPACYVCLEHTPRPPYGDMHLCISEIVCIFSSLPMSLHVQKRVSVCVCAFVVVCLVVSLPLSVNLRVCVFVCVCVCVWLRAHILVCVCVCVCV